MGEYENTFSRVRAKVCSRCGIEFASIGKLCPACIVECNYIERCKRNIILEKEYFEGDKIYSFKLWHLDNYYVGLDYWKNKYLRINIDRTMPHREAAKKEILIHARVKKLFKKYAYSEKSEMDKALKDFAKWCKAHRLKCENARRSIYKYKRIEERSKPYVEGEKRKMVGNVPLLS